MLTLLFGAAHYLYLAGLALVSYLIGRRLTHAATYHSLAEEIAICTALGLVTLAYTVFGLGLVGWLRLTPTLAAVAVLLVATYPVWLSVARRARESFRAIMSETVAIAQSRVSQGVIALACLMLLPLFILPLYPPAAYDATMYHLPYARLFIEQGALVFAPYLRYPVFPQLNEMLFTLALMFYDDVAPQMIQFFAGLLTALTLYAAGRRFFTPRVGVWAAALWLGSPLVVWIGSSAYVDVGMTLFITLGVYALGTWLQTRATRWAVLAGLFAGCGASSKYLGLFFLGVVLLVIGMVALRSRRPSAFVMTLTVAFFTMLPWYGRIVYFTGNPVFPFYTHVFGSSEWNQDRSHAAGRSLLPGEPEIPNNVLELGQKMVMRAFGRIFISPDRVLLVPWRLTFDASFYGGEGRLPVNPLLFFAAPALLWAFFADARVRGLLILVVVYTLFWLTNWPVTRYFMPGLPILCLAAAGAIDLVWRSVERTSLVIAWQARLQASVAAGRLRPVLPSLTRSSMVALLTFMFFVGPGSVYGAYCLYRAGPHPVTPAERNAYLARRLPLYAAFQFLNERLDHDYTIYSFGTPNFLYFVEGQLLGDIYGPARFSRIRAKMQDGQTLYDELRGLGVEYLLSTPNEKLPNDVAFRQLFKPIYHSPDGIVYELTVQPPLSAQ